MGKTPYVLKETRGRVAYCACGHSKKLPHCDGSHKGSGVGPRVVNVPEDRTAAVCACGRSGSQPYCDGSHKNV